MKEGNMSTKGKRGNIEKIAIYSELFIARTDIYGTYNPETGKTFQKKEPVTKQVILNHLLGKKPYGMYMLVNDKTNVIVIDFDDHDKNPVIAFINRAMHYNIPAYLERSKSKGWHLWIFFEKGGISAAKARTVAYQILEDIDFIDVEIFPKQNATGIGNNSKFGNFVNAPMNGSLVPKGKTLFINPMNFEPYEDQWTFLKNVKFVTKEDFNNLIEINNWKLVGHHEKKASQNTPFKPKSKYRFQLLPPCAQKMLFGVKKYQRLAGFRLAIHLKNIGFPCEITIKLLKIWATHNRPINGKKIITEKEIISQTKYGYKEKYNSYGCGEPETKPFCSDDCPLYKKNIIKQ